MITPRFSASQNDERLILRVEVPYFSIDENYFHVDGKVITFYASPYYLRLCFSGELLDEEYAFVEHNIPNKEITILLRKKVFGEFFSNLDMITSLIASSELPDTLEEKSVLDVECDSEFIGGYGFNKQHVGMGSRIEYVLGDVLHVKSPSKKTNEQIRSERELVEKSAFDEDHYLADFLEPDSWSCYSELNAYDLYGGESFTSEEQNLLVNMKNVTNLSIVDMDSCCWMLIDVLFAYCYDRRTTEGESNVESAWTVSTLSTTLSWLEYPKALDLTLISCLRRSLCYPLFRSWKLSLIVLADVIWLLGNGRRRIVKALLYVHQMFVDSEPRYLFNQLYIDELCVWVQNVGDEVFSKLAESVKVFQPDKKSLGLQLDEWESLACHVANEEEVDTDDADVASQIDGLKLDSDDSDSEADSSSSGISDSCDQSSDDS